MVMGKNKNYLIGSIVLALLGTIFSLFFILPALLMALVIWTIWNVFIGDLSFWQALGFSLLSLFLKKIFFPSARAQSFQERFHFQRGKKRDHTQEEFIDVPIEVKDKI